MTNNVYPIKSKQDDEGVSNNRYPSEEWIKAGIMILRSHNFEQITIKALCERVDKTAEEFIDIFKNLDHFVEALLEYWYEKQTLSYIDAMDEMGGNAEENLLNLMEMLHNADKEDEIAIRNWALKCPKAKKTLEKVDRTRLDVGIGLLTEMGFSENQSRLRAKILYTASIGTEYTSISSSLEQKKAMCALLISKD